MAIQKFEDIIVWQKPQDLAVALYSEFKPCNDFGFKDQITKAAVSISNNISEGFERSSNADFKRFLFISLASNSEVRSMLYLAQRLEYVNTETSKKLIEQTNEISRMLYGFIKSMTNN